MQEEEGQSRSFEYRLAEELSRLIPELTDWDIKPPTGAQMAYAVSLCAQLGIVLPAATRRSRGLTRHGSQQHDQDRRSTRNDQ